MPRVDEAHRLDPLGRVHGDQDAHDLGAPEVEDPHVQAGVPARDVGQVVDEQRVAADVEPARCVRPAELEDAAHHVGQHQVGQPRARAARARGDAQPALALGEGDGVPGVEAHRAVEPQLSQRARGLLRGEHGNRPRQPLLGHPVEVVAVEVRQQDEVDRRQVVDLDRGVGEPSGAQPVAERARTRAGARRWGP